MSFNKESTAADFCNEGLRCLRAGRFAEAITLLEISTSLCAEDAKAFAALCLAAHEEDRHDLLYASFMKLTDLPNRAVIQRGTAVSYYDGGYYEEAIISALESISLCPDDALSNYILGRSYMALHMFGEAKRVFRRALELAPDFTVVDSLLLWIDKYLSVPERERVRLLVNAPRVPMHDCPLDIRELEKHPFTRDSISDLYGNVLHNSKGFDEP